MLDSLEIKDPTSFSQSFPTQNKTNKQVHLSTPAATKAMLLQTGQQKTMSTTSGSQPGLGWQTPVNGNYGPKRTKPASPSSWGLCTTAGSRGFRQLGNYGLNLLLGPQVPDRTVSQFKLTNLESQFRLMPIFFVVSEAIRSLLCILPLSPNLLKKQKFKGVNFKDLIEHN